MTVEIVVFEPPDLGPVLDALDPKGWVNLQPEVDHAELPESTSGLFGLFGGRGPAVPFSTWHPGERSAGIQHGAGPKVAPQVSVPAGWRVAGDHSKRGLVVRVPAGVSDEEVLRWLIAAATTLSAVPVLHRWVAEVHS